MIKYNPLYKNDGTQNGALTTAPSDSIVFDLPGLCIWVKGVKLKGTDTTYSFSHDNYITLTNTPGNPEDIKIGVDITTLKPLINSWRSIYMNQDLKLGSGYDTKGINFKAGSGIQLTYQGAGTGDGKSGSNDYGQIIITANNLIPSNNVTGSGTANYITKWTGTNTIGNLVAISNAITTQTTSTKFLREDGTWAVPSYINDSNTWRPIQINGSEKLGGATNTGALNFIAGIGIEISWDSTNKNLQITNSETSHTHKFKLGSTVIETAAPGTADNALTATTVIAGPLGISATSESRAFSILGPSIPNHRRADHWIDTSKYYIFYKSNNIAPMLEMSVLAQSNDENVKKTFTVRLTLNNSTDINNDATRGAFHPSKAGGLLGTVDRYWYQVHAAYFMKHGSDDTYVLLGGGGHALLSSLSSTHNHDSVYVLKAGDTMTGALTINSSSLSTGLIINRLNDTKAASIEFKNSNGSLGFIGMYGNTNEGLYRWNSNQATNYKIWDSGNDGSGSGLDADTLDGYHANDFTLSGHEHTLVLGSSTLTTGNTYTSIVGPFAVATNASAANAFSIWRGSSSEGVQHWVTDDSYNILYTNDEKSSWIDIGIVNTDTESPSDPPATTNFHVKLSSSGIINPGKSNTGLIGDSNKFWYSMTASYFKKAGSDNTYVLLGGGGAKSVSDFATSGHIHPLSIETDNGTNLLTLSPSTKYKLTAGNNTFIFTTPVDRTGIKLGTVSGTKKIDSTVIINNSSTGLTIAGGTNKFSIGDGTNYIEVPITISHGLSTKNMNVNGTNYAIYTSASSLPTFFAPGSLGSNGQLLGTNGSAFTWITPSWAASNHDHAYIKGPDNRSVNNDPSWYMTNIGSASVYTEFCMSGGAVSSTYESRITFTPWGDHSGQRPVQLAFNNSGMFMRTSASDTTWNAWNTVAFVDDISNHYWANVKVSTSSSTTTTPTFGNTTTSHHYMGGYLYMQFEGSWLSTIDNDGNGPIFGHQLASNNRRVYYTGSPVYICGGSYNNYASGITVNSSNNVGIGTTTPSAKLHIYGNNAYNMVNIDGHHKDGVMINYYHKSALKGHIGYEASRDMVFLWNASVNRGLTVNNESTLNAAKFYVNSTPYILLHTGNSSVSKSGETLTVNVGGTSYSLTNTWRGIQDNLTSTSTSDSLSANLGRVLNNKFDNYLVKTTYDYHKEFSAGSSEYIEIGCFNLYDSMVGVDVTLTTSSSWNGRLIISSQNINDSGGGSCYVTVRGDNSISMHNKFSIVRSGKNFRVYLNCSGWMKVFCHIWCVAASASELFTTVSSMPTSNITINNDSGTFGGDVYATNFYTTSDHSKKQNISSFSEHIRKFQLKDTEKWHYGVIALEVPEMFRDGEEGNMTVNYNSVLSYYVGQLENRVKELEDEIKELKNKLK